MAILGDFYASGDIFWATPVNGVFGSFFMNTPYYLLRGGYLRNSSLTNAGSDGYYWSSTPYGSSYAYLLYFYSGGVSTNYGTRYGGQSVRCVAAG